MLKYTSKSRSTEANGALNNGQKRLNTSRTPNKTAKSEAQQENDTHKAE